MLIYNALVERMRFVKNNLPLFQTKSFFNYLLVNNYI